MKDLKPQFFKSMKGYNGQKFARDFVAGIIVAIVALPLSIALALASGVKPEQGIYTAIIAGFLISFLGGSTVQIAGPTAAFAPIVAGIVATKGMDGLVVATILAGIILVIMGFLRLGSLIKFIPFTVVTGFTAGIAVTILIGQVKDFMGLTVSSAPIETMDKVMAIIHSIGTVNWMALLVGAAALAILVFWPKKLQKLPPSLVAVLVCSAVVKICDLQVYTIGDLYTISSSLPHFAVPAVSLDLVESVLPNAFTIAVLAAIESLLSAVVADGMVGTRHNSNMELIAQGVGNACSGLFGGIPATGAIARTAANIKNGGRTPVAGMVHAIVLLLTLVLLMPYAAMIPMPVIAAILFMVAYNMSGWRTVVKIIRTSPKSDIAVLVITFVLTVVFDLVVAIAVGLVLAAVLFLKRMADVSNVYEWKYAEDAADMYAQNENGEDADENAVELGKMMAVPADVMVFEITGPMFFGVADKLSNLMFDTNKKVLILRMRSVPAMDITAMNSLESLLHICHKKGVTMLLSHVNEQPMSVMVKAGFDKMAGEENFCANIDAAIARAAVLCEEA